MSCVFSPHTNVLPQAKDMFHLRSMHSSVQDYVFLSVYFFNLSDGTVQVYSNNMISFVLLFLNPNASVSTNVCLSALAKRKQAGVFRIEGFIRELANPEYRQAPAFLTCRWQGGYRLNWAISQDTTG